MADDLEDEIDPLEGTEGAGLGRIARPPAASTIPPLTLRGVGGGVSQPNTETGSTEDLENRGLAAHTQARPVATPSPLESKTTADQAELGRLQSTGSGISQIQHGSPAGGIGIAKPHPILGGILRGLNIAGDVGSAFLPELRPVMKAIPGTEEHHNSLVNQQAGRIGEDLGEQKEQTGIGEAQARTDQSEAAASKDAADAAKAQHDATKPFTPEKPENVQQVYADAVQDAIGRGVDPNSDPKVQQLADTITRLQRQPAGAQVPPLSADQATQRNALWNPILQKNHLPTNAFKEGMTDAEAKELAQQLNNTTGRSLGDQHLSVDLGNQADRRSNEDDKKKAAAEKQLAPYQETLDAVSEARDYANQKSGPGDYALLLRVVDATKPKAGFRFTQSEQNLLIGARSLANSADAMWQKAAGGQLLTDQQRTQMLDVLGIVEKHAQTKIGELQGGAGREGKGAEPTYATNPKTKERVMSTDGGKTWQPAPAQ